MKNTSNDHVHLPLGEHELLIKEEERALLEKAKLSISEKERERARDELIRKNIRFVIKIAWKNRAESRIDFEDLVSAGIIGLMQAIDRYNLHWRVRLQTYAVKPIWWRIQEAKRNNPVTVPKGSFQLLAKAKKELKGKLGRLPTEAEFVEFLQNKPTLLKMRNSLSLHFSLDAGVGDEEGSIVSDFLSQDGDSVSDRADLMSKKTFLNEILNSEILNENERQVLKLYFGLGGCEPMTYEAIGKNCLGLTRERIRQIKEEALAKIRKAFREQ